MAIATKKVTDYRKISDTLYEVHPKTEASQVIYGTTTVKTTLDTLSQRDSEFIRGTQSAATGSFTGVTTDAALYDGKRILYWLPYAGSGNATLNLTLADGTTTGAKNVYYMGTTRLTTHYGANNVIPMTYNLTNDAWYCDANYDTNNTVDAYDVRLASMQKAAEDLPNGCIVVGTSAGYKKLDANVTFDISYPVLRTRAAIASGATVAGNWSYITSESKQLTATPSLASKTFDGFKAVYIAGTLNGNIVTVSSEIVTQTLPSSEDGKVYLFLGVTTTGNSINFFPSRTLFAYRNGKLGPLEPDLSSYAVDSNVVHKTGTETVSGQKTFSNSFASTPAMTATQGEIVNAAWAMRRRFGKENMPSCASANGVAETSFIQPTYITQSTDAQLDSFKVATAAKNYLLFAHLDSDWTVTCSHNINYGIFTNGVNSTDIYKSSLDWETFPTTPFVLTYEINSGNIDATDVLALEFYSHRGYTYTPTVSLKIEVKWTDNNWYTAYNLVDTVLRLDSRFSLWTDTLCTQMRAKNVTDNYIYIRGIRLTFSKYEPGNTTAFNLAEIALRTYRGTAYASYAVNAMPLSGGIVYGGLYPSKTLTYDIGTSSKKWNNIYGNLIGNVTGNVTGNVSGNAGTATAISTSTWTTAGNQDTERPVWISYISPNQNKPCYSNNFTYNNSTDTLTVGKITGEAGSVAWANVTGKPSIPSESEKIYNVISTNTASAYAWTGAIEASSLVDGMTVAYYMNYGDNTTANFATLNLTLSGGTTTGAINVYTDGVHRAYASQFQRGRVIMLKYWSAGSIKVNGTATTDNRWVIVNEFTHLGNWYGDSSHRTNTLNLAWSDGGVRSYLATSAVTEANGKPKFYGAVRDSHVLHFCWDNSNSWGAQIAITDNHNASAKAALAIRCMNGSSWANGSGWKTVALLEDVTWANLQDKPTTLSGYGITDAKIESGTITLGSVSITPLPSTGTAVDSNKLGGVAASSYALKSDITGVYKYKGSVATVADLPASGNTKGDIYDVQATGMNYAWNETEWDPLGQLITVDSALSASSTNPVQNKVVNTALGTKVANNAGNTLSVGNWVQRNNNSGYIRLSGGSTYSTGANLVLYGESNGDNSGRVRLIANDGTNSRAITIYPGQARPYYETGSGTAQIALVSDIPTTMAWSSVTDKPAFATVATTGSYTDLSNTPGVINLTAAGTLNWNSAGSSHADNLRLINANTLAYWNGSYYSNGASNLEYVKLGKLGNVVTHANTEFVHTTGNETVAGDKTFTGKINIANANNYIQYNSTTGCVEIIC